jgi:hypothetical protein
VLEAGASLVATLALGQSALRGIGPARSIPRILAALAFYLYAHARAAAEILKGLEGRPPEWVRTAKTGAVATGIGGASVPTGSGISGPASG